MVVNHYLTTRQTPRMTIQICRLSATPERAWDRFRGLGFYSMVCFLAFSRLVVRTSGCLAIITRPTLPRCVARPRMHSKRGLELHEQFQNPSDVFQRRNVLISFIGSIGSHLFPPRQSENKEKYSVPLPLPNPNPLLAFGHVATERPFLLGRNPFDSPCWHETCVPRAPFIHESCDVVDLGCLR